MSFPLRINISVLLMGFLYKPSFTFHHTVVEAFVPTLQTFQNWMCNFVVE